jgi:hypothetical protein
MNDCYPLKAADDASLVQSPQRVDFFRTTTDKDHFALTQANVLHLNPPQDMYAFPR